MPTQKTRLNMTLPKEVERVLTKVAERDEMPTATKALQLLVLGIELEEDAIWDRLARERDTEGVRFVSHKEAWG